MEKTKHRNEDRWVTDDKVCKLPEFVRKPEGPVETCWVELKGQALAADGSAC